LISAGVQWSLAYEWAFYIALPFLALFRRPASLAVLLVAGLFYVVHLSGHVPAMYFGVGMASAAILRSVQSNAIWWSPWLGVVAVLLLCACQLTFRGHNMGVGALFLSCFFFIIASGNTLFGLLATRPARLLGTVSYSLYLMQGIVLFICRAVVSDWPASGLRLWMINTVVAIALVLVSAATYRWVEHPFIGRRTARAAKPAYDGTEEGSHAAGGVLVASGLDAVHGPQGR
jgi:peptidoglycan/LPS O-acetylase OafA/YrhL